MKYYPINLDIRNKKVVIVGGGSVAHQKVVGLLEAKAQITLISPHLSSEISELSEDGKFSVIQRKYEKGDLEGAYLVFGATNNSEINRQIHEEAKEKGILFNAVDQPDECDFIIPSRISRGDLLITISTAGTAPFLSKAIRKKLEPTFGAEYKEFVKWGGNFRNLLIQEGQKEKLIPFFDQFGEKILESIRENDFLTIQKIVEKEFGIEIAQRCHPSEGWDPTDSGGFLPTQE